MDVDHYEVLGLPSGVEGAKLIEKEISKAYKFKALELHPDKRPDDPNARANFQKLKSSYDILKDEKARKLFDDLLKIKHEKQQRQSQRDSKKRKMMSDLEERERAAFALDPAVKAQQEEKRIARQLKEEIERIRAMHVKKEAAASFAPHRETKQSGGGGAGAGLDKEKMLKVSWEKVGEDYTAERLRELFSEFGAVEDVVIKSSKKKGSALIVMANKDAVDVRAHRVLRVLLSHMAYADDDESLDDPEDIKPRFHSSRFDGSDNLEDDCSAAAFDVLSNVFADEILPTLMPINQAKLSASGDEAWKDNEAAVLALGAIAESCLNGLYPHLSEAIKEEVASGSTLQAPQDKIQHGEVLGPWKLVDGIILFKDHIYFAIDSKLTPAIIKKFHGSAHEVM
ncbi:hypothetical protein JRO89_XS02G0209200 [Xanthoceras sorbifolium]|uniref:J domain-containing protein n=1 Tax=Xanthoceras sorbifolium TaxID=99658 RepID=A0ABQ8IH54_9ROSI|nr:hypothetical protein JRO89_XS02G0209200 [Xanthoceras sorbifolium]